MVVSARFRFLVVVLALLVPAFAADSGSTRREALAALSQPDPALRRAGAQRLGEVGTGSDADQLVRALRDPDAAVRALAAASLWKVWARSGERGIDALYQRGIAQMESSRLREAVGTFSEIIRRKPSFAEAWNKRATIYYLLGDYALSLKDCEQVLQRNPNHFGALSGTGQIHLQLGDIDQALVYFERALAVNPNLESAAAMVLLLRQMQDRRLKQSV